MIELNETMIMPLNGICILLAVFFMVQGWVRGGLRSVLSYIGTIVTFYGSWILAGKLSTSIPLIQNTNENVLLQEMMSQAYAFANKIVWFVICFLIFKIILFILDFILKSIQNVPGYHFFSCLSGLVFGVLESVIWIFVICVVLESPLFIHGSEVVDASLLGTIRNAGNTVSKTFMEPVKESEQWSSLLSQMDDMADDQIEGIKNWIQENPVNGEDYGN